MPKVDRSVADPDRAARTISQVHEARGNLSREAKLIGCLRARNLQLATRRSRERSRHVRKRRRDPPQLRMVDRRVVDAASKPSDGPGSCEARKRLVDGRPAPEIQEVGRHVYGPLPGGLNPSENPILNRLRHVRNHM
jgi:hypothetical protein